MAFLTIVTRNYYWWAKTWAESVRRHHPEAEVIIAFADRPTDGIRTHLKEFQLLSIAEQADEIPIKDYRRMAFGYTPFELTCALKPFVVRWLHRQYDRVVYMDADTSVYRHLREVLSALEDHNVLVTPHLLRPQSGERESRIRAAGTLNGGFLATRRGSPCEAFLDWWAERCRFDCYIDPYSGHFVDQSWLDLAPSLFDPIRVLRDESLNVAYWNIDQRTIRESDGNFFVGQQPLGFFHFSGFEPGKPNTLSRFDNQVLSDELLALTSDYRTRLRGNQHPDLVDLSSEFSHYEDGTEISIYHREAIRCRLPELDSVEDPFQLPQQPEKIGMLDALRPRMILSRKVWQMEELQQEANQQTQWIRKRQQRRLDRRVLNALRGLYSLVADRIVPSRTGSNRERAA